MRVESEEPVYSRSVGRLMDRSAMILGLGLGTDCHSRHTQGKCVQEPMSSHYEYVRVIMIHDLMYL